MDIKKTAQQLDDRFNFSWVPLAMTGKSAGKRPFEDDWQKYCDERRPFSEINHKGNVGITTGPASGVIALDIDEKELFKIICEEEGLDVPETFTVMTGSGGEHNYYTYPTNGNRYGNRSCKINKVGVFDVRGTGGQVVAPGSIHLKTGNHYKVVNDADIAEAPQWLLDYSLTGKMGKDAVTPPTASPTAPTVFDWGNNIDNLPIKQATRDLIHIGVPEGDRSEAIMTVLCALVWAGLTDDDIVAIFEIEEIGEKYRSVGNTRVRWLSKQIDKARLKVTDRATHSNVFSHKGAPPRGTCDFDEMPLLEWPTLGPNALRGFAGDFVDLATRNSEADPAAVLMTFLVRFGVEVGLGKSMEVGDTKHKTILSCVIVGSSSKARKGTSAKPVDKLFSFPEMLFDAFSWPTARSSKGPFSSGEGIIYAIRDAVKKYNAKDGQDEVVDPGVEDKRLFVLDEEFGGVLANTKREGNTLSMIIRQMWDGGTLDPLTKNNKIRATGGIVGWVSHITLTELGARLAESESFNGFANRILWALARRQKLVPLPAPMDRQELETLQARLLDILRHTKAEGDVTLSQEAIDAWCDRYYADLTKDRPGLAGCTTNRGEAQVLRLAMIYCLLDGEQSISLDHLESGIAVWEYCEQSANYIFAGKQVDATAQRIIDVLQQGSMSSTELYKAFGNHLNKAKLDPALKELLASNRITAERRKTKGAPATIYHISKPLGETCEFDRLTHPTDDQPDLNISNSLNSLRDNKKTENTTTQLVSNGEFWVVD